MGRTSPARQPTRSPDRAPLHRAARPSTSQVRGTRVERLRKRGSRQPGQGAPGRRPPGPRGRGGGTSRPVRELQSSEERGAGKEVVSTFETAWWRNREKKKE